MQKNVGSGSLHEIQKNPEQTLINLIAMGTISFVADTILRGESDMGRQECIAMVLAGGKGTRLGSLTTAIPKPIVPFGGQYRLIDFTLSNCVNSGMDTVGILTPPTPFVLPGTLPWQNGPGSTYIHSLPPGSREYAGTADAVYANSPFINRYDPEHLVVLSGDHIYKMDYRDMLECHKANGAAVTIAVTAVPWSEASRFGVMTVRADGRISEFVEKPANPRSNMVSMGVYVFNWAKLKSYLDRDHKSAASSHDFGKNIIPAMMAQNEDLYAYRFGGYWRDVGTVESLYDAHMDLLRNPPPICLDDAVWPLYATARQEQETTRLLADKASNSLLHSKSSIKGTIAGSVIFGQVKIGRNANIMNSVIMPGAVIGKGARVERALIGPGAVVRDGCLLRGGSSESSVAIVRENAIVAATVSYA